MIAPHATKSLHVFATVGKRFQLFTLNRALSRMTRGVKIIKSKKTFFRTTFKIKEDIFKNLPIHVKNLLNDFSATISYSGNFKENEISLKWCQILLVEQSRLSKHVLSYVIELR
jgi:5-methylcytosine-specific restriction endonuclease McrBC regulatory subunit McrC